MLDSNIINKYKDKSTSKLIKRAEHYFNKYIRLRDTDEYGYGNCISSGQPLKYGTEEAQAGHYFSAGKIKELKFDEDNVHLQGKSDNYYNGGNESMYVIALEKKIGRERVVRLQQIAQQSKRERFKYDRYSLIETIETYKKKVKEISKRKMFDVK